MWPWLCTGARRLRTIGVASGCTVVVSVTYTTSQTVATLGLLSSDDSFTAAAVTTGAAATVDELGRSMNAFPVGTESDSAVEDCAEDSWAALLALYYGIQC